MTMNLKRKKIIAREILLLFGVLTFTGLVWFFLFCRNYYYDNQTKSNQQKVFEINTRINNFPFDRLNALYEGINKDFVINYSVNDTKYLIPKKQEQDFLKDYPTAKLLPISPKGYSYTHIDVFKKYGGNELYPKNPPPLPKGFSYTDSTTVFNFVTLNTFRDLLKGHEYKDKLYKTFSEEYDLGTKLSFDSKIEIGLKYSNNLIERKRKLLEEKQTIQTKLNSYKSNFKSNDEIFKFLIWTLMILGIIIYPFRGLVLALRWTIRTLKQ